MKLRKIGLVFCLAAALFAGSCPTAEAYYTESASSSTYNYSKWGFPLKSPDAYDYSRTVDLRRVGGYDLTNLIDMFVADEYIYIVEI